MIDILFFISLVAGGAGLLWIAASASRFDRYGREALIASGLFLTSSGILRLMVAAGILGIADARSINSVIGPAVALIVLQAVYLEIRSARRRMA